MGKLRATGDAARQPRIKKLLLVKGRVLCSSGLFSLVLSNIRLKP